MSIPDISHADIYFEVGRKGLTVEGKAQLLTQADMLRQHEDYGLLTQAYTDQRGQRQPFGSDGEKLVSRFFSLPPGAIFSSLNPLTNTKLRSGGRKRYPQKNLEPVDNDPNGGIDQGLSKGPIGCLKHSP